MDGTLWDRPALAAHLLSPRRSHLRRELPYNAGSLAPPQEGEEEDPVRGKATAATTYFIETENTGMMLVKGKDDTTIVMKIFVAKNCSI